MENEDREFVAGLDLGQQNDYSAFCVLERIAGPEAPREHEWETVHVYHSELVGPVKVKQRPVGPVPVEPQRVEWVVRSLERWRNESYEKIARRVQKRIEQLGNPIWACDQTGVGRAVIDRMREFGLAPVPVTIHGGDQTIVDADGSVRLPKRELVGLVAWALQSDELVIGKNIAEADTLVRELKSFRARITLTGHDTYGAGSAPGDWREAPHDDMVLSLSLALWAGRRYGGGVKYAPALWG